MRRKTATSLALVGIVLGLAINLRADVIGAGAPGGSPPAAGSGDPIVGTNNTDNCIPFACSASFGLNIYQQVYSSSAFSGLDAFNQISFFLSQAGNLDSGTYQISFSYTSKPVNGLSSASPGDNIGADETLFGTFGLNGSAAPSTLVFSGNTFTYDPTMGNLLMTIVMTGVSDNNGIAYYEADSTGLVTSRAYFGTNQAAGSAGLVTGFNVVPEPTGIALFATVLLGCWSSLSRRPSRRCDWFLDLTNSDSAKGQSLPRQSCLPWTRTRGFAFLRLPCRASKAFRPAGKLFRNLGAARVDGSLGKLLPSLARIDVLVIDDFVMTPLGEQERHLFLEICDDRYRRCSTVLSSQLLVARWHKQIGDPTIAASILDRLVHNAYRFELDGESIRKTQGGRSW
jgi:IstB-like ATP binding protein